MDEFENSINEIEKLREALQSAATVFLNPSVTYKYEDIIQGVQVNNVQKKAVNTNTTMAFGRKLIYGNFGENKNKAMKVCDEFFVSQKARIIDELITHIRTKEQMDKFGHELYTGLKEALLPYSTLDLLEESYNRIRKVVNLYLEHIVAMAEEIDSDTRRILVPLLSMPIDSWIMKEETIFESNSLNYWGLTRKSKYGEIKRKEIYDDMQSNLEKKADIISKSFEIQFYVIYFDMFWKERWKGLEGNLFGQKIKQNPMNNNAKKIPQLGQKINREVNIQQGAYPQLVSIIIAELEKLDICLGKTYRCIQRKGGEYILEVIYPSKSRKNIITIWANKQDSGEIRLVDIGKYGKRRKFDIDDIRTKGFSLDLLAAYRKTQE